MSEAFVTLVTNDEYAKGACTLGYTLRRSGTSKRLLVLVTTGVTPDGRDNLLSVWDEILVVYPLESTDPHHLELFNRPELRITFTKLKAWQLTQFNKCVFLDADTMVLQNIDDLFQHPEISAAPDIGWPDCFNTGVFVFDPSNETFDKLMNLAAEEGSFDGGDQGLLNRMWKDWSRLGPEHRLSFTYNMTTSACYTYVAAWRRFGHDVKIIHFIGSSKPWHFPHLESSDSVELEGCLESGQPLAFTKHWWKMYKDWKLSLESREVTAAANSKTGRWSPVYQCSSSDTSQYEDAKRLGCSQDPCSIEASVCSSHPPGPSTPPPSLVEIEERLETERRSRWESGHVDYTGMDRFSSIQAHLDKMIKDSEKQPPTT